MLNIINVYFIYFVFVNFSYQNEPIDKELLRDFTNENSEIYDDGIDGLNDESNKVVNNVDNQINDSSDIDVCDSEKLELMLMMLETPTCESESKEVQNINKVDEGNELQGETDLEQYDNENRRKKRKLNDSRTLSVFIDSTESSAQYNKGNDDHDGDDNSYHHYYHHHQQRQQIPENYDDEFDFPIDAENRVLSRAIEGGIGRHLFDVTKDAPAVSSVCVLKKDSPLRAFNSIQEQLDPLDSRRDKYGNPFLPSLDTVGNKKSDSIRLNRHRFRRFYPFELLSYNTEMAERLIKNGNVDYNLFSNTEIYEVYKLNNREENETEIRDGEPACKRRISGFSRLYLSCIYLYFS